LDKKKEVNVVCAKWGKKYPAKYVNNLFYGVSRWMDRKFRFLCFTDDPSGLESAIEAHPLPIESFEDAYEVGENRKGRKGAWRKISLLKPGLAGMQGQIIVFDIDVVITGSLSPIIDYDPKGICFRREWRYSRWGREGGHGSVYTFNPQLHPYLYEEFAADPIGSINRYKGSEQYYTSMTALKYGKLRYLPDRLVCSFKRDLLPLFPFNMFQQPSLPEACSVLCFHGQPTIEEAIRGVSRPIRYRVKPCNWLREYWKS
jgi:hypothetical protein